MKINVILISAANRGGVGPGTPRDYLQPRMNETPSDSRRYGRTDDVYNNRRMGQTGNTCAIVYIVVIKFLYIKMRKSTI